MGTSRNRLASKRLHNCLVPYAELPPKEQGKDQTPVRNFPLIVENAGYRIVHVRSTK